MLEKLIWVLILKTNLALCPKISLSLQNKLIPFINSKIIQSILQNWHKNGSIRGSSAFAEWGLACETSDQKQNWIKAGGKTLPAGELGISISLGICIFI